jgi:signal peptidase I
VAQENPDIAMQEEDKKRVRWKAAVRSSMDYVKAVLITIAVAFALKVFVIEAYRIPSGSMENTLLIGDFLLVNKLAYGLRTPRHIPLTNVRIGSLAIPLFAQVRRGDIVVFEYPNGMEYLESEGQVNYIKRCIGLPGDTVMIRESKVFVNGKELTQPSHSRSSDRGSFSHAGARFLPGGKGYTEDDYGPVVVPREGERIQLNAETFEEWKSIIHLEGHRVFVGADGSVRVDGKETNEYVVEDDYYFMLGDNRHNSLDSRYWGFVPDKNLIGEALMVYWSWDPEIDLTSAGDKVGSIRWNRIGTFVR